MNDLIERIERMSIPEPNTGCWLWLGTDGRKIKEGRRLARLAKSNQRLDEELIPFVRHWHRRGHSVKSIALSFDVSTGEIERAVA